MSAASWTQEAIANDEELIQRIIEKKKPEELEGGEASPPPLREWDQTASLLATLIEEQRQTNILLIAQKAKKGTSLPKLQHVLRPKSAYERLAKIARFQVRVNKHDSIVAKLLGDRAKQD